MNRDRCVPWQLGLVSVCLWSTFSLRWSFAQIVPDVTLGAESSTVVEGVEVRGGPADLIDGGAIRGSNLFHSFQEFNVMFGRGAYFSNPESIENILTRVTGGNISNINGTLGVLGTANLFFINPSGIVFGPGASLDLNGSFVGSTSESLLFEDYEFSAVDPSSPPMLTLNLSIGLQAGENPGDIVVRSQLEEMTSGEFAEMADAGQDIASLQVPPGETLVLVGGNVTLEGGELNALGGHVKIGGLGADGMVLLTQIADNVRLFFPEGIPRADVALRDGAVIDVRADSGGSITIQARNLEIAGQSALLAGIAEASAVAGSRAGDVALNATEITIRDASSVQNQVNAGAIGNSGNINIASGSFVLEDGARVNTSLFGIGNAGVISIKADEVAIGEEALASIAESSPVPRETQAASSSKQVLLSSRMEQYSAAVPLVEGIQAISRFGLTGQPCWQMLGFSAR